MAEDIKKLVTHWTELIAQREQLAIQDQDLVSEIELLKNVVYRTMEELGVQNMALPQGSLYFKASGYPKLLKDPEEVIKWFDEHGRPDIAPRKVLVSRIKEYIADAIDTDKPFPPEDLVEVKPVKELHLKRNKLTKGAN